MTDSRPSIFQFTLGPVQGFVAQARRTRDFWAGSFILSWLSSVAIAAIEKQGGKIQFPVPDEGYMRTLTGQGDATEAWPQQGSIPNRFLATTAQVPAGFHPEWVAQAVKAAWLELAREVWQGDLQHLAGSVTETIWQRQINNFWEISWVLSDTLEPGLLDRRKSWRNPVLPEEPGHKCMVMDGWQELSGESATQLGKVNAFWAELAAGKATGLASDLGSGQEHLCALAYIKRRFSRYFKRVAVELPHCGGKVHGWPVPSAVPSVAFLAAAPWLSEAIRRAPQAFESFHEAARKLVDYAEASHVGVGHGAQSGFDIDIECVKQAAEEAHRKGHFNRIWAGLDGQVYFDTALENHNRLFGPGKAGAAAATQRALQTLIREANVGKPSPYYAILLMDGDQLGKHMVDPDKQTPISQALNRFTQQAGTLVRQHNGFLIYAGGDDVLALLPLPDALPAAAALQAAYADAFRAHSPKGKSIDSTLSGAIEFVHFRTPLTRVLQDAHRLLDDIAKEATGRNAIAVRVWKPSGLALQWAMPWEHALDAQGRVKILQVAENFAAQGKEQEDNARFSSKFFFRMKDVLERFDHADEAVLQKLLLAEYLHSFGDLGKKTRLDLPTLQNHLNSLLEQCRSYCREHPGATPRLDTGHPINPDAALLVRFLAQKGQERD